MAAPNTVTIDRRAVWKLVYDKLVSGLTGLGSAFPVYAAAEEPKEDDARWVRIVRIDYEPMPRNGADNQPDVANIVVALTIGVREAKTRDGAGADVAALETARTAVVRALQSQGLTDSATPGSQVHTVGLGQARDIDDGDPEPLSPFRTAGVIIAGCAARGSGSSASMGGTGGTTE